MRSWRTLNLKSHGHRVRTTPPSFRSSSHSFRLQSFTQLLASQVQEMQEVQAVQNAQEGEQVQGVLEVQQLQQGVAPRTDTFQTRKGGAVGASDVVL